MQANTVDSIPYVSVLMTAYNSMKFISEAIESIQNQSFRDFELIIVDDASEDNTFGIAAEYAQKDKRIRLYKNKSNIGDYANRIVAANLARGKYLKYLDSDNYLYPHGLDVLISCMDKYPDAGLGLCKLHEDSHPLPDCLSPRDAYREAFLKAGLFNNAPSSAIIRASTYRAVGGFQKTRHRGDFELWLKLAAVSAVVRIPGLLDWGRKHPDQESNKNILNKVGITYQITIDSLTHIECPLSDHEKNRALQLYIRRFLINTFIKRMLSGEFGLKDLPKIFSSLNFSRIDFYRLIGRDYK